MTFCMFFNKMDFAQRELGAVGNQEDTTSGRVDANSRGNMELQETFSQQHWTDFQGESQFLRMLEPVGEILTSRETNFLAQMNKKWGERFLRFHHRDLIMGDRIGEGAEAVIFEAKWLRDSPEKQSVPELGGKDSDGDNNRCREEEQSVAVKVFKGDIAALFSFQQQWPSNLFDLQYREENCIFCSGSTCNVLGGVMLKEKKYALVMNKYDGDLRTELDRHFLRSADVTENFGVPYMYGIAAGMRRLHSKGILHRDLKASNVLVKTVGLALYCYVADFQCSRGSMGTGFWRAPEVLDAIKKRRVHPNTFTEKTDVYSYGMTCYEIVTGKIPFGERPLSDYDHVIRGGRPDLPNTLHPDISQLIRKCWHNDPDERPYFSEVLWILQPHLPHIWLRSHLYDADWREVGVGASGL